MNHIQDITNGYRAELLEKDNRITALEAERDALDADLHNAKNDHTYTLGQLHIARLYARAWKLSAKTYRTLYLARDAAPLPFEDAAPTSDPAPACLDALDSLSDWDDSAKAHTLVSAYTVK